MQPSDSDTLVSMSDAALRKRLVEAAIRAPSGDNCQPWRFRFTQTRMDIDIVRERAAGFFDFRDRGTLLSVGAVIENVRVQAASLGLGVTVTSPRGEAVSGAPAASITLHRADRSNAPPPTNLLAAMHGRTVNRRPFLPVRIAPGRQRAWVADPVAGTQVTVFERHRDVARWARVTCLGDRIRWTHPTIHRELFASVRFSREDAGTRRVGLEIDRIGAGPVALPIMRWLQPWARMKRLCRYGMDRLLAQQTRALAFCAGALVLVTIDRDEPEQWIRAGEQMQRLWITSHQQGLCVQPLPVSMYLDQRYVQEGTANFLPAHQPLLEEIRHELADLLGNRVGTMLYRVGHGWQMSGPAVRLPAESFYDEDGTSAAAAPNGRATER